MASGRQGRTVFDDLADRIRALAQGEAKVASPPVGRGKVLAADPMVIDMIGVDLVLEEGDPDVEFDRAVLATRPAVGDTVRVHHDGDDWIVAGVVRGDGAE